MFLDLPSHQYSTI